MALSVPDPNEFMSREIAMEYLARLLYLVTTCTNNLRVTHFHHDDHRHPQEPVNREAALRVAHHPTSKPSTGMQLTLRWDNVGPCVPHLEGQAPHDPAYRLRTGIRRKELREVAERLMLDAYAAAENGEDRIKLMRLGHYEGWETVAVDLIHEGHLDAAIKLILEYIDIDKLIVAIDHRIGFDAHARERLHAQLCPQEG